MRKDPGVYLATFSSVPRGSLGSSRTERPRDLPVVAEALESFLPPLEDLEKEIAGDDDSHDRTEQER